MGKKKGGAKNKLARMSEEERARYLQHRADMEEEARRRKQQLVALYMKNKLKREEAFSRLNLAKINQEWRSILRQIKCQQLKREIMEFEKLFQDSLEQKNRIIRRLLTDLDEAEDLYSNLQQSHMENIDRLNEIESQRMSYFKKEYLSQKAIILKQCNEDFTEYKEARYKSQTELESVYFALEEVGEKQFKNLDEDHLNRLDDLKSGMALKLENITKSREEYLELLWREYQKILSDYVNHTEAFYSEYSELRERDEENTRMIRSHCYEVARATDHLAGLKIESDNALEESEFQISYLEKYRKSLNEKFLGLKKNLENKLKSDDDQFRVMGVCSHEAIKNMEKSSRKGEQLLQLATVCRRLESEREKIMPFEYAKRIMYDKNADEMKQPPNEFKDTTIDNWLNMEMFWTRVNNVRLDNACLFEEKVALERENAMLKAQLKDYLTTVTIASGPNGNVDDRMFSRPSSMKVEKVVHIDLSGIKKPGTISADAFGYHRRRPKRRPFTCVEANLSNAVRSLKIAEGKMNTVKLDAIVNW